MKRCFFVFIGFLFVTAAGCTTALIDLTPSKTITIEITGESEQIEYATYLETRSSYDTTAFNIDKNIEGFLNQPLEGTPIEIKMLDRNKHLIFLPLNESFSVSSNERLYIFLKPYNAQKDILVKVKTNGKRRKEYILKPNNFGLYLSY